MKRRIKNGKKEWRCDMCNQWFEVDEEWDKKGAKEECKELGNCIRYWEARVWERMVEFQV